MRGLFLVGWLLLLLVLLWPLLRKALAHRARRRPAAGDELVKDPVCQTYVVRSRAVTRETGGRTHYFCSRECAARFRAIPGE